MKIADYIATAADIEKGASISRDNSKMGGIPSISFPPGVTCAAGVPCLGDCYARRMAARRPSIAEAWARNLRLWKTCPELVAASIKAAAMFSTVFRYFVGGDIPDAGFFAAMVDIARAVPTCHFLAFTKKYSLVNEYITERGALPANLKIIFSEWREYPADNPHGLPVSRVIFKGDTIPEGAAICGGNCFDCLCRGVACWTLAAGECIYFYKH